MGGTSYNQLPSSPPPGFRGGSGPLASDNLSQVANEGRLTTAGNSYVRLYEEGAGTLWVVIVAGAGDCADSWVPIRHQLAHTYRVLSYDRAGIGGSEEAAPASVDRYLTELDEVVNAAPAQGQVILAGHSLGGLIARLYQHAHPDRVSGLVLLDSTPEPTADDRGVQAGFIASSITARLFKVLTPLGFTRFLLKVQKMPLYPEQPQYQAAVSAAEYDRWITMVCNSFGRCAGAEL
jgi:pimeloyl-ACP methyl ester carboxylesterase